MTPGLATLRALGELLVEACAPCPRPEIFAQVREPLRWLRLAEEEDVLPLLGRGLLCSSALSAPPWAPLLPEVTRKLALARAETASLFRCAREGLLALSRAQIRAAAFKGVWLAEHLYPEPYCRRMGDVDLLVVNEPMAVLAELEEAGFISCTQEREVLSYACAEGGELGMVPASGGPFALDLHFQLYPDLPAKTAELMLSRAKPGLLAGVQVLELELVDQLLLVAHHLVFGMERPVLRWWFDVDRLARRLGDPAELLRRSAECGNVAAVLLALSGAESRFGTPLPPDLIPQALSCLTRGERGLVRSALAQGVESLPRDALLLCQVLERRTGRRRRSLVTLLWPPRGLVAVRRRLAPSSPRFLRERLELGLERTLRMGKAAVTLVRGSLASSLRRC